MCAGQNPLTLLQDRRLFIHPQAEAAAGMVARRAAKGAGIKEHRRPGSDHAAVVVFAREKLADRPQKAAAAQRATQRTRQRAKDRSA